MQSDKLPSHLPLFIQRHFTLLRGRLATPAEQQPSKRRGRVRKPARQTWTIHARHGRRCHRVFRTAMATTFHNFLSPLAGRGAVAAFQPTFTPPCARCAQSRRRFPGGAPCSSRRNCKLRARPLSGGALLRIASHSSLASQFGAKQGEGERRFGFLGTRKQRRGSFIRSMK